MIAYTIVLLTELSKVDAIEIFEVQVGTMVIGLHGDMVRSFVHCMNKACASYPEADCLEYGLEWIPPEYRDVFTYLYETCKELIT